MPTLSINDVTLTEGNSGTVAAVFTVNLSVASGLEVTVDYATADGTATAGSDYAPASGQLIFNPGEMSHDFTVDVGGDGIYELNEVFFVGLGNPSNAIISDGEGTGQILNDDGLPVLIIGDSSVVEGNVGDTSIATFSVSLSNGSYQSISVSYSTIDGTATAADSDYMAASGQLTFAPEMLSRDIAVNVIGDNTVEADELYVVALSAPVGATIASGLGVGIIVNDDLPAQIFADGFESGDTTKWSETSP